LDEPTSGLSVEHVPEMVEVIRRLHREEGRTILMVEHRMDLVIGLSDRIAVMHQGRLLRIDTPDAVMADPVVQQAYLGPESL
jgi:branched-chain amino acid transport system ATP-binding protein